MVVCTLVDAVLDDGVEVVMHDGVDGVINDVVDDGRYSGLSRAKTSLVVDSWLVEGWLEIDQLFSLNRLNGNGFQYVNVTIVG